jgi:hypothetical protein
MMLKRCAAVLAAAAVCWIPGTAMASTSSAIPANLLPMATSWQSPSTGIVLAYPSRDAGAKPYLLATSNAGKTWRSLPAPPLTYPGNNDQPDAAWVGDTIAVTNGTGIEVTADNGKRWSAEHVPSGLFIDEMVLADGRMFTLLSTSTGSRTAVYSGPLGGGSLRAVSGLSVSGSFTYGDITTVGTLQVELGADYATEHYWYSSKGVRFVPAPLPCPVTGGSFLGGMRDGHVIALCNIGPSEVGPGQTENQIWIATKLGGTFHAAGPLTNSPNDQGFAAASASDMTVATNFDLAVTRDAGRTWTAEIPQNNGAFWSDLSFSTATTGTVVCSTVNDKLDFVATVYRTTNAGRTWTALKL